MSPKAEERRNLTILFADLSGFTRLSSGLDPEDVREVVTTCFEILNKPIVNERGTIHRYEGDSVIALFGYPVAHEDDPERAIKASLAMIDLIPEVNSTLGKKLGKVTELGLHIGINRGTVVIGEMGSKEKKEHTVLGEAVNLSSRLKDVAEEGKILVSEPVFRESRYLFDYEVCEPVTLKGIDEPVKTFKPLHVKKKPEPKRGIKGLFSPMIGRDRELNLMLDRVRDLSEGKGSATFILGPAGIGKSRLLHELKRSIAEEHLSVHQLEGSGLSYGEALPYWPFLQILKEIYSISDPDSKEEIQEKLSSKTRKIFPDTADDILPYLGYLFSIRFPGNLDEKIKHLDAQALRMQIFVSIKRILGAMAQDKPLLVTIEDYHWIDKESLELLTFLLDTPEPSPISFFCLSRIEKDTEPYKTKENLQALLGTGFQEIQLTPLNVNASDQLLNNLLRIANISKQLKTTILHKAEGNPFYVEEIIRSLIDTEVLEYSNGTWIIAARSDAAKEKTPMLKIPDSVQGVIRTRLDRLDPDVKLILENASIIGRSFLIPILERLCSTDRLMLSMHLAILEEYEYINEHKKQPEIEYLFRHPMLHEVTYNGILKKRRRELHARTAEIIEQTFTDRLDDFAELLAHQYSMSNNTEKAIEWIQKAGRKAKDRFANDEAIRCFRHLLEITEEDLERNSEIICETYDALGAIYALQGKNQNAIECYEAMYHNAAGNKMVESEARRMIAGIYQVLGRWDDALEILAEIEDVLSGNSVEEQLEKFELYNMRSSLYKLKAKLQKALESCETALTILQSKPLINSTKVSPKKIKRLRAMAIASMAAVYYTKREFKRSIELWEEALRITEELEDRRALNSALNNLGVAYYSIGELKKAMKIYHQGLRISNKIGDIGVIARTSSNLGVTYYMRGECDKAIELFLKCLAISEEIGDKQGVAVISGNLGVSNYNLGNHVLAHDFFQKQLRVAKKIGYKPSIGKAMSNLAHIYRDLGEFDKAIKHSKQSIKIAKELNDQSGLGERYYYMGSTCLQMEDKKKAMKYFGMAGPILREAIGAMEDKKELLDTYIISAELNYHLAQLSEGKKMKDSNKESRVYVEKGLRLSQELGSEVSEAKLYVVAAKFHACSAAFTESEKFFKKAIDILKRLKQKKLLAESFRSYIQSLKKSSLRSADVKRLMNKYSKPARKLFKELKLPEKL